MEYVREIFAQYDRQCIRVYQAYNPIIAKEAISLQTFGENFDVNRMTWIKPSFLWLMHATPEQYPALQEEYRQYAILPEEYAAKLLGCL